MSVEDERDLGVLEAGASALGLTLDAHQMERFARYRELLLDWNSRINLTAITDPAEVVTRHFLDSLTCAAHLPGRVGRKPAQRLLDVGAGAGFPGLPLAIALPSWDVTLLEATGKKVRFLEAVIDDLKLINAHAVAGRAEDLARQPAYRGRFDSVTARAVASLPTLLEYCAPFARAGGLLIFPKKGEITGEIDAGQRVASLVGVGEITVAPVTLPALADGRMLVVAQQERPCPPQYPRAAGAPVKRPLST